MYKFIADVTSPLIINTNESGTWQLKLNRNPFVEMIIDLSHDTIKLDLDISQVWILFHPAQFHS